MRIGAALLGIVLFIGASYGAVTVLKGYQAQREKARETVRKLRPEQIAPGGIAPGDTEHRPPRLNYAPAISRTGPWPKAVIDRLEFDFGRMEVGELKEFQFEVRNEGAADLEISQGDTTCQCTISEVPGNLIPPGGKAQVTLRWKTTTESDANEKGAEIRTNDPENKSIHLHIFGMVAKRFMVMPDQDWDAHELSETEPTKVSGHIVSPILDDLAPTQLQYDESLMDVRTFPINLDEVTQMRGRSGFGVEVSLKPGAAVGSFRLPIQVTLNAPARRSNGAEGDPAVITLHVTGHREGPVRILGPAYLAEEGVVGLGTFDATKGNKVELNLLVRNPPEEGLKFTAIESDPPFLKVELNPESKGSGAARRYQFQLEFPAGSERSSRRDSDPARVRIKTNHPDAAVLDLKVHYTAF